MVEVKNFCFLKRPFLTKKGKWFFVTLRGGRGGGRASVTFVTKKWFFLKASLNCPELTVYINAPKNVILELASQTTLTKNTKKILASNASDLLVFL